MAGVVGPTLIGTDSFCAIGAVTIAMGGVGVAGSAVLAVCCDTAGAGVTVVITGCCTGVGVMSAGVLVVGKGFAGVLAGICDAAAACPGLYTRK